MASIPGYVSAVQKEYVVALCVSIDTIEIEHQSIGGSTLVLSVYANYNVLHRYWLAWQEVHLLCTGPVQENP